MNLKEKKVSGKIVFKGNLLEVHDDEVICPNGNKAHREFINKGPAACVIPLLDDGRIILEKQFRYSYDDVLIEFPAGKTEENEDPKITALRELKEETGYEAKDIKFLGITYPSVAYVNEKIYLYLATNLKKGETHLDENEFVDLIYKTEKEISDMILQGEIKDAKSVHAFSLYLLSKNR